MPMNPVATVVLSVLVASASAAAITLTLAPAGSMPAAPTSDLDQKVGELLAQQQRLEQRLDALAATPMVASAPVERTAASLDEAHIAAAVEAYLARRAAPGGATTSAPAEASFELEQDFDQLIGSDFWSNPELWKRVHAAGRMAEVIDKFAELAKANPNDTRVQMDLANACLAYVQMDPTQWQYSVQADGVFDRVLALDENHWEARFTKAMSYTFWPEFTGKKTAALKHFERLVAQQEQLPPEPHHVQTYLFLGNLLQERDPERARAIWRQGLQRHPNHAELQQRLAQ